MLKGRTTLWRELVTLEEWAADNLQYSLGTRPWLVMVQDGARGLLSSPDSLSLFSSPSVFKEQTCTHICMDSLPSTCPRSQWPALLLSPRQGNPRGFQLLLLVSRPLLLWMSPPWSSLLFTHIYQEWRYTLREIGFYERMGHLALMKWRTHT